MCLAMAVLGSNGFTLSELHTGICSDIYIYLFLLWTEYVLGCNVVVLMIAAGHRDASLNFTIIPYRFQVNKFMPWMTRGSIFMIRIFKVSSEYICRFTVIQNTQILKRYQSSVDQNSRNIEKYSNLHIFKLRCL